MKCHKKYLILVGAIGPLFQNIGRLLASCQYELVKIYPGSAYDIEVSDFVDCSKFSMKMGHGHHSKTPYDENETPPPTRFISLHKFLES